VVFSERSAFQGIGGKCKRPRYGCEGSHREHEMHGKLTSIKVVVMPVPQNL